MRFTPRVFETFKIAYCLAASSALRAPSPKEKAFKVFFFGEDLGEALNVSNTRGVKLIPLS